MVKKWRLKKKNILDQPVKNLRPDWAGRLPVPVATLVITTIYILKATWKEFGQTSSIVEKLSLFINALLRLKAKIRTFSYFDDNRRLR